MNIEKPRKIIMEEASADSPRSRVEAARSENASRRKALVEEVKRLKAETSDQGRAARVGATMKQFQTHVSDAGPCRALLPHQRWRRAPWVARTNATSAC